MEDFFAVLAVAAGFVATGTLTAAAYQVARHFRRLNRAADRTDAAARERAGAGADAATVTRSELEAMIRAAVRSDAGAPGDDDALPPLGAREQAVRAR